MRSSALASTFRRLLRLSFSVPLVGLTACASTTMDGSSSRHSPEVFDGSGVAAPDAGFTSCGERIDPNPMGFTCYAACYPFDPKAIAGDAVDAGRGQFNQNVCAQLCTDTPPATYVPPPPPGPSFPTPHWFSCAPATIAGASMIRCQPDCTGRRPAGLEPCPPATGPALGAVFADMARLEAASVHAFRSLRDELAHHGAPRSLVRAAARAARDEVRHARLTHGLARRHGGASEAPVVRRAAPRGLESIAIDNAVEGCVRETFGAFVATRQAEAAADPIVRAAMKRIARDETRHAALSHSVDAWIRGRLDRRARTRVDEARARAAAELIAAQGELDVDTRRALGLPGAAETQRLATLLFAEI